MTKKRSSEILADENLEIFREKVNFDNFSESENLSKIGGTLKQGGNASWSRGMDAPAAGDDDDCLVVAVVQKWN